MAKRRRPIDLTPTRIDGTAYDAVLTDFIHPLESARHVTACLVNTIMTASC
jgi:hypothetical protein